MIGKLREPTLIWMDMFSKVNKAQVDASSFVGGEIIFHQQREHFYQIINRVNIKCPDGSWEKGWSYVRVKDLFGNGTAYEVDCDPDKFKMYVRQDDMFDHKWLLIRKPV